MIATKRFLAWIIVLVLSISYFPALAKGNETVILDPAELIELLKIPYEIVDPEFDDLYEHKYVSEDGKIEKWFCSYEPMLDGLIRTDEKRWLEFWDYALDEKCGVEEEHAHLHHDEQDGLFIPSFNEENYDEDGRHKYRPIVKINKEAMQLLNDYKVYRLIDNIHLLQVDIEGCKMLNHVGTIYLVPKMITDKNGLEATTILNDSDAAYYTSEMNGYLISNEYRSAKTKKIKETVFLKK